MEIPKLHALVLPMVKDFFLVGMLVAELISPRPQEISKHGKVKALRPEWPPRQGTLRIQQLGEAEEADGKNSNAASPSNIVSYFSEEQQSQGRKIAQSLAIASVMDQVQFLFLRYIQSNDFIKSPWGEWKRSFSRFHTS